MATAYLLTVLFLILDEDLKWIYYGSIVSKEAGYAG